MAQKTMLSFITRQPSAQSIATSPKANPSPYFKAVPQPAARAASKEIGTSPAKDTPASSKTNSRSKRRISAEDEEEGDEYEPMEEMDEDIDEWRCKKPAKATPAKPPKVLSSQSVATGFAKAIQASSSKDENVAIATKKPKIDLQSYSLTTSSSSSSSPPASAGLNLPPREKLTPLQQQYYDIKIRHPDTILFVECGYKYRFFGEDAEIAAKVLGIMINTDHLLKTCSVPTFRLHYHVARLVNAGYKVGVVSQTETAALKAIGNNRNNPFTRNITALYTKATIVDREYFSSEEIGDALGSQFLLCLCEQADSSSGGDKVRISALAVQVSTGDILYEDFVDGLMRQGLDTLFVQLQPSEVLLPRTLLSKPTDKLLSALANTGVRIERIDDERFDPELAAHFVENFYASLPMNKGKQKQPWDFVRQLPRGVITCLAVVIHHLQEFKLESIFQLTSIFTPLQSRTSMYLPASSLQNLEVFASQSGQEKGTLFHALNMTRTLFGRRLLKRWLAQPLRSKREIEERLEAVEEIMHKTDDVASALVKLLEELPDLERIISRAYFRKVSPSEFLTLLEALQRVSDVVERCRAAKTYRSSYLSSLFENFPDLSEYVATALSSISISAARENNKDQLFSSPELFPEIENLRKKIEEVKESLKSHLMDVRKELRMPSLEYVTKNGEEFLVEVSVAEAKRVPANWIKMSSTKACVRYHTPYAVEQLKRMAQLKEQLAIASKCAWEQFLTGFADRYVPCRAAVHRLAAFDCLLSFATASAQNNWIMPEIVEDSRVLEIEDGRNPIVEALLQQKGEQFIPNSTQLSADKHTSMIITGPNMGGKSCYLRQVALIVLMAQIGCRVPARSAKLTPVDAIYTRMGASDNILKGRSTFFVELQETSFILQHSTANSLVILDELGRGTSTHDGTAVAFATLDFLVRLGCWTLFVTHYPILAQLQEIHPRRVGTFHMSFTQNEDKTGDASAVTFLYRMVPGVAPSSFGLNVAALAGIPEDLLRCASAKSRVLRATTELRRQRLDSLRRLFELLFSSEDSASVHSSLLQLQERIIAEAALQQQQQQV